MASIIPDPAGIGHHRPSLVSLPNRGTTPARELALRGLVGLGLLTIITLLVWVDRGSYADNINQDGIDFIDALYYATVTMTTTGYGDITPVSPVARLVNALIITPLRIIFLVLLVGTTLEVLATEGRRVLIDARWRKRMRNHILVIGYGTKGRSAVSTLARNGRDISKVVVIDSRTSAIADANLDGVAAIEGDATRRGILRRAEMSKAREVIITLDRDDSAILVTLTARQLNPRAHIVVAVREEQNVSLLRQSGADSVVTSSEMVGRLLGMSAVSPNIGTMVEDILTSGDGLEISERQVRPEEVGHSPSAITDERVLAVVRNKTLRRYFDPTVASLELGDELVVVRRSSAPESRPSRERDPLPRYERGGALDDD